MKLNDYLKEIESFIKDYLNKTGLSKYILGLSGGVDSSLVAAIASHAVGKEKLICVAMPIDSNADDLRDAKRVAEQLGLDLLVYDASSVFHKFVDEFKALGIELDTMTLSNLKVRIRMCTLYAIAQKEKGLVLGTDNADERYTGYFTKYGDGGVDVLPIVYLLKREVVEGCKIYGLSNDLAERTPSAGLFEGQTDETEMRVTYKELDDFLLGKEISKESKDRIEYLHRVSEHKRAALPTPISFDRE